MSFWKTEGMYSRPTNPIVCQFCGKHMVLRWSNIHPHSDMLHEIMRREDGGEDVKEYSEMWAKMPSAYQYVDDMQWKCEDCGCCQMFGRAISLEQFKELRSARHGCANRIPIEDWRDNERIKERLMALGYF